MKRLIAFAILSALCLGMIGCSAPTEPADTTPTAPVDTFPYPKINQKLTWDAINAFPLKSSDMTEEELRQHCIDFFLFAKTALWIPNSDWSYQKTETGSTDEMTKGLVYGGLPYIGNSGGNIYRLMDYLNEETGVVDMTEPMLNPKQFGNQCANGAGWAWARVINSVKYGSTFTMVQSNGYLRVGPYTYDDSIIRFQDGVYNTADVIRDNGAEVMFQSYAALKKADGLVNYVSAGHVMMVCTDPVVVYTEDGEIDPSQSHLYIHDQHSAWSEATNEAGDTFQHKNYINKRFSFAELLAESYIPFTFAEFLGTDPVEETQCDFNHTGETINATQLNAGSVTSNYYISDIYAIIRDSNGNEQHRIVQRAGKVGLTELNFNRLVTSSALEPFADGSHTVEIICQLGTGERLTLYTGQLVS